MNLSIRNKLCGKNVVIISGIIGTKYETKYLRMDQVKNFKGCLPQILLGLFVNTLSYISLQIGLTIYFETFQTSQNLSTTTKSNKYKYRKKASFMVGKELFFV